MNANTPQTERLADAFERITEMLESESSNTMITGPNNEQVPQDTLFSWFAIVLPMMKYVESSTAVDPAMKAIHFPWV
ncbi:hypothetical protein, partial [Caballeronia sp. BR00000012568055]|uniref:hypothetical protein n=1 Tax=Caballeronia sp. BR00000012568055 TaxID=2918761 RepID=UPI0023F983D8